MKLFHPFLTPMIGGLVAIMIMGISHGAHATSPRTDYTATEVKGEHSFGSIVGNASGTITFKKITGTMSSTWIPNDSAMLTEPSGWVKLGRFETTLVGGHPDTVMCVTNDTDGPTVESGGIKSIVSSGNIRVNVGDAVAVPTSLPVTPNSAVCHNTDILQTDIYSATDVLRSGITTVTTRIYAILE